MAFLRVLFTSEMYTLGSDFCVPINGPNIEQLYAKCSDFFGYQPAYLDLIKPQPGSVSLFDRLFVDFGHHNKSRRKGDRLYGACQVRNDTGHRFTLRYINDTLGTLFLENLAHTVLVNQSDMTSVDFISPNLHGITRRSSRVICNNGASTINEYAEVIEFCMESGYKSTFTKIDLDQYRVNASEYEHVSDQRDARMFLWSSEKFINANQLMNEFYQRRNISQLSERRDLPFEICENDMYWYTNLIEPITLHYIWCFNWHMRMGLLSFTLIIIVTIISLIVRQVPKLIIK